MIPSPTIPPLRSASATRPCTHPGSADRATQTPPDPPFASVSQPTASCAGPLAALTARGFCQSGRDLYFDAPDAEFAQPALQAVMQDLDLRWIEDRIAQAAFEQAAHARLREYASTGAHGDGTWQRAATLVAAAVAAGWTGALGFGAFAAIVGQVGAAMNGGDAGFGGTAVGPFTATAAGRQVLSNLVGAVPGSLAYGACNALGAVALRPLVEAVALLLSAGAATPVVPVDPATRFPTPSPLDAYGWPKAGETYNAELAQTARLRAEMARAQASMTGIGERFNLGYGTPLFAAFHAVRLMYQAALQVRGRGLGSAAGAALSSASSGGASAAQTLAATLHRLRASTPAHSPAADGSTAEQALPLFVTQATLRRIRGDAPPPLLRVALPTTFRAAGRAFVQDTGPLRKLVLGIPASALAVWVSTVWINVLVPMGSLLASTARASPPGAIATAGAVALVAYAAAYLCVAKSLAWAARSVARDPDRQRRHGLALGVGRAMDDFARRFPDTVARVAGHRHGAWSAAQAGAIFDEMNRVVIASIDATVAEGGNPRLDPGAGMRLRAVYLERMAQMRHRLMGTAPAALPGPGNRRSTGDGGESA